MAQPKKAHNPPGPQPEPASRTGSQKRGFERAKLPTDRPGFTHKFQIGDLKGYLTVSTYDDGRPGEIFLKMDKQGSLVSGFCDAWAMAVSLLLQAGVPLDYIVNKYKGAQFEPSGYTKNPDIRIARSPVDYVVRWLEVKFAGETQ